MQQKDRCISKLDLLLHLKGSRCRENRNAYRWRSGATFPSTELTQPLLFHQNDNTSENSMPPSPDRAVVRQLRRETFAPLMDSLFQNLTASLTLTIINNLKVKRVRVACEDSEEFMQREMVLGCSLLLVCSWLVPRHSLCSRFLPSTHFWSTVCVTAGERCT